MRSEDLTVLHVAGPDMPMRLPSLLRLKQLGVNVHAAGSGGPEPFEAVRIPFHHYPLNGGASPLSDVRTRAALTEIISEIEPQVVHSFSTKPCVLVPPVARSLNVPVVLRTVCGLGYLYSTNALKARLMRIPFLAYHRKASRAANVTIFQNEDDHSLFLKKRVVHETNSALIPGSGVDIDGLTAQLPDHVTREHLRAELNLDGRPVVTMISRLVEEKGVHLFLEAARSVRKKHPEVRFMLVGPIAGAGGRAVSLKTIESYSDDVQHLGYRKDIPALLSLSDVFVLPSRYREGVPRVLMEAAALGLGLVTTNMPGCRDVVINEQTGLLIEPDDQTALNRAITRMIESPEERIEFGARALQRIRDRFEVSKVVDEYLSIYSRLLGEPITRPTRKAA